MSSTGAGLEWSMSSGGAKTTAVDESVALGGSVTDARTEAPAGRRGAAGLAFGGFRRIGAKANAADQP